WGKSRSPSPPHHQKPISSKYPNWSKNPNWSKTTAPQILPTSGCVIAAWIGLPICFPVLSSQSLKARSLHLQLPKSTKENCHDRIAFQKIGSGVCCPSQHDVGDCACRSYSRL